MKSIKSAIYLLAVLSLLAMPAYVFAAGPAGGASIVLAGSFDITLSAGQYSIVNTTAGLQTLSMADFVPMSSPGDPALPHRAYNILLPPMVVPASVSLSLVKADREPVAGSYRIAPAGPLVTEDDGTRVEDYGPGKDIKNGHNMNVYGSNTAFPSGIVSLLPGGQMRKWKFVGLDFTPFQLNPASGSLEYVKSVTVRISYNIDPFRASSAALADRTLDGEAAQSFYNFGQFAAEYVSGSGLASNDAQYDYVIITTSAIQAGSTKLASFVAHKQARGHSVLVVNQSVWGAVTGVAPNHKPEKIRKWLQDNYVSMGIVYVLLIGDPHPDKDVPSEGDVPMKYCWPRRGESQYQEAPTDLYYSDLTGNWDLNGNGYFGEWDGDCGSGGLDVNPEVFVGRIPVYAADYASLDSILQKTMDYENESNYAWRKSALLPMSFSDNTTDGAYLAEQMKDDYLTAGGYSAWRMYQTSSRACTSRATLPCEQELRGGTGVRDRWAAGDYGMVAWWAHGSETSATVGYSGCSDGTLFQSSYTAPLDDAHSSFTYQCSCTNGSPEWSNNLQYSLLKRGSIGAVSATRVSWYYRDETDFANSASNSGMGYEYIKRLSQNETAGRALGLTRQALWNYVYPYSELLMNFLDFNLYGDPSIGIDSHGVPGNFTIVALPDTQYYSSSYPATFTTQTQWIVNNRAADNIVFVTHEGNIVSTNTDAAQWTNADTSLSILDGRVPYGMAPGNHDGAPGNTANFNSHFPYTRYSGQSWYGGHYDTDNNDNSYQLFSAGGQDFIILHIEYGADSGVLAWADGVLKANPARRAILTSHYLLNTDGSFGSQGRAIYDALKGNPNLFLMLCGHMNGEARRSDIYKGHTIYTLLADYQDRSNGGDGWLRTLEFSPADNTVAVRTYSPTLNRYETDADSQFTLSYEVSMLFNQIGVFRPSTRMWYLDYNGDGRWNLGSPSDDRVKGDFGLSGDIPVVGDWNADNITEIGVFRPSTRMWYLDLNDNGRWDGPSTDLLKGDFGFSTDIPVVGDWNHDGRDEIGVFRPSTRMWYLDYNGDGRWNLAPGDDRVKGDFGLIGDKPVVGDWNNDGTDEIGVFRPSTRMWYLDYNGDGRWMLSGTNEDRLKGDFGLTNDKPVVGDWNNDGTDEIGVFRPSSRMWYLDYNGDGRWMLSSPGDDRMLGDFGRSDDIPVVGAW